MRFSLTVLHVSPRRCKYILYSAVIILESATALVPTCAVSTVHQSLARLGLMPMLMHHLAGIQAELEQASDAQPSVRPYIPKMTPEFEDDVQAIATACRMMRLEIGEA